MSDYKIPDFVNDKSDRVKEEERIRKEAAKRWEVNDKRIAKERKRKRNKIINTAFGVVILSSSLFIGGMAYKIVRVLRNSPYDGQRVRVSRELAEASKISLSDDTSHKLDEIREYLSLADTLHKNGFDGGNEVLPDDIKMLSGEEITALIFKYRKDPSNVEVIRELTNQASLINGKIFNSYSDVCDILENTAKGYIYSYCSANGIDILGGSLNLASLESDGASYVLKLNNDTVVLPNDIGSLVSLWEVFGNNVGKKVEVSTQNRYKNERNDLFYKAVGELDNYQIDTLELKGVSFESVHPKGRSL